MTFHAYRAVEYDDVHGITCYRVVDETGAVYREGLNVDQAENHITYLYELDAMLEHDDDQAQQYQSYNS